MECEGCRQGLDLECGVHLDERGMPISICGHEPDPEPADTIDSIVDFVLITAALVVVIAALSSCGGGDDEFCPAPTCDEVNPTPMLPPLIIHPFPGVRIVIPNSPGPAVSRESRGAVD